MKRVVITGMGVASGIGNSLSSLKDSLESMSDGFRNIDIFSTDAYDVKIGSTVQGLNEQIPSRIRRLPRPVRFLWHATRQALEQSSLITTAIDPTRVGCYMAGPACSLIEVENYFRDYVHRGPWQTSTHDLAYASWDSAVNEISREFSLMGPRNTILTACSSSGVVIGLASDLIRLGEVDAMVAGGTDGFSEFTFSGFQSLQSISPEPCRPFDVNK